uniref:Uncharacterized protein n=1 Tax=Sphaerodactylus townsendi TaxID=933632 RepID=A0ACB8ETP0_9SAUR
MGKNVSGFGSDSINVSKRAQAETVFPAETPGFVHLGDKDGSKVTTVVATPGQGPDRPQEVSYTDTKVIGNGSFGVVYQAKLCDSGELVAIKKVLQDKRFKGGISKGTAPLAMEGTRLSRAKTIALTEAPAEDLHKKKKAAGKDGTAPVSKRPRGPATGGSLVPSEGAAVSGGSDTGSSYPMRDSESPVLPPGQEEPEAPVQATTSSTRQEPGPGSPQAPVLSQQPRQRQSRPGTTRRQKSSRAFWLNK